MTPMETDGSCKRFPDAELGPAGLSFEVRTYCVNHGPPFGFWRNGHGSHAIEFRERGRAVLAIGDATSSTQAIKWIRSRPAEPPSLGR